MIQRIQSLFLLASFTIIALLFKMPFAEIFTDKGIYIFKFNQIKLMAETEEVYLNTLPVIILLVLIIILISLTIFLFRKRMLQIRLSIVNMVLNLGLSGLMFYYVHFVSKQLDGNYQLKIAVVLPIVVAILLFLAIRYIGKDEALIRSVDRIR